MEVPGHLTSRLQIMVISYTAVSSLIVLMVSYIFNPFCLINYSKPWLINSESDGNEYNKNGAVPDTPPSKRGDAAQEHPDNVYVTQKGKTIHVPVGANAGDRVWTPLSYDEDMEFDQDVVVGPANQTSVWIRLQALNERRPCKILSGSRNSR